MSGASENVIPFPAHACRVTQGCPQCGTQTNFWRFGRLLWGYCDEHELRWVAADFGHPAASYNVRSILENLKFLASFDEVSSR